MTNGREVEMGDWREAKTLEELFEAIRDCMACPLGRTRTNLVLGSGNPEAEIMFVGEAPGFHEDRQGIPFVGPAGQFLDQLLRSIGLQRSQVYIANTLKCRPPENRDPLPEELSACTPYLFKQIEIIRPRIICTLGNHATKTLLRTASGISQLHGRLIRKGGLAYVPLFHPAAALHKPPLKTVLVEDFQRLKEHLDAERVRWAAGEEPVEETLPAASDEQPEQMGLF
ncbi:uracil-DNA glycosylase [Candidatus Solincola tengchongensis]|uniref:uracil-DNA glycosylase n=1 Tax=Candidatus Solincola tengchongensis TaxID=2900693 RepID=UPI00257CF724|nr:uracil-DNA glycosylase [Candidatus Solincola tengchongensis]